jgi:hypothetical protein
MYMYIKYFIFRISQNTLIIVIIESKQGIPTLNNSINYSEKNAEMKIEIKYYE